MENCKNNFIFIIFIEKIFFYPNKCHQQNITLTCQKKKKNYGSAADRCRSGLQHRVIAVGDITGSPGHCYHNREHDNDT